MWCIHGDQSKDQQGQIKRVYHKALADGRSRHPPVLGTGGLGLTDEQLEEVVSACCLDRGRARSESQVSGCSEFGLSDAQLEELTRTCDLLATDGNGSAGVPARASEYSEAQKEQIKRVYHKSLLDAQKALADANKALADRSSILGTGGLGLTDKQLEEVVSAYCIDGGRARSASQASGCSEFGLSDTQLEELARTCDLLATKGIGSAGASARASEYSED